MVETWSSAALGIRLTPPDGWATIGGDREAVLSPPAGKSRVALFSLPVERTREDGATDMDRVADAAIASLDESFEKFKLLGRRTLEVAGQPAREIYFRARVDGERFRFVQTVLVHRDHRIYLMYMAPDAGYTHFLGDYDHIVRSIRLLPQEGG